jgi:hypothetical protein
VAVDSGNGIQALWKLNTAIMLDTPITLKDAKGNNSAKFLPQYQAKIEDVEARVEAAMLWLGSKAGTQNIDRILRLPGTVNLPNAKKRKAGRVPCQTRLISFNGGTYSLDDFPPPLSGSKEGSGQAETNRSGVWWAALRLIRRRFLAQ